MRGGTPRIVRVGPSSLKGHPKILSNRSAERYWLMCVLTRTVEKNTRTAAGGQDQRLSGLDSQSAVIIRHHKRATHLVCGSARAARHSGAAADGVSLISG